MYANKRTIYDKKQNNLYQQVVPFHGASVP